MEPKHLFRFCPRCGSACPPGANPFTCAACALTYFFNPTCAAAAFLFDSEGRALFVERAKEPAKGKLAIPGGFIDIGETAEEALRREVREEVGLEIDGIAFLASFPNSYAYRGVHYPVCDFIFTANIVGSQVAQALDGVAACVWKRIDETEAGELAFPSMQKSLQMLKARLT
jgi:ADP-ribose pyrophosphatase YjhB (NUDIX family)